MKQYHKHVYYPASDEYITSTDRESLLAWGSLVLWRLLMLCTSHGIRVRRGIRGGTQVKKGCPQGAITVLLVWTEDFTTYILHIQVRIMIRRSVVLITLYDKIAFRRAVWRLWIQAALQPWGLDGLQGAVTLYVIVDGGYHAWRCLQYPMKQSALLNNMRWSKRLESVRKVSENGRGEDWDHCSSDWHHRSGTEVPLQSTVPGL